MRIHRFKGDHREIGVQQGASFKDSYKSGLQMLKTLEQFNTLKPKIMPAGMFLWIAGTVAKRSMEPIFKHHAPNQRERIKGMAEAAGIPEKYLWLFSSVEVAFGENDYEIPIASGCTSVLLGRTLMSNNHLTIARNFDYASFVLPYLFVRRSDPSGGYRSMDITAAPLPGTFNGFNEDGLFLSTNEAFPVEEGIRKPGLPASVLIQEALETCGSVQDAIKVFKTKPRGSCNIITLADRQGDLVSLEYTSTSIHEVYPGDEELYLVATNHYITPDLAKIDLPRNAVFGKKAPRSLCGVCINETSFNRRKTARSLLGGIQGKKVDRNWLFSLLRNHDAGEGTGGMETICHHDPVNISAASMVIDLDALDMWACIGLPCEHDYDFHHFEGNE